MTDFLILKLVLSGVLISTIFYHVLILISKRVLEIHPNCSCVIQVDEHYNDF